MATVTLGNKEKKETHHTGGRGYKFPDEDNNGRHFDPDHFLQSGTYFVRSKSPGKADDFEENNEEKGIATGTVSIYQCQPMSSCLEFNLKKIV